MGAKLFTDSAIAEALGSSHSIREAAKKLGMHPNSLEHRCRQEGLVSLYTACAERGKERRGPKNGSARPLRRWAISWKPPGAQQPIRIWSVETETREEAMQIVEVVMPKFIPRKELGAAEEIR